MNGGIEVSNSSFRVFDAITKNWVEILQLAFVVAIVYLYQIEGPAFLRVIILATAGFMVSIALPISYRLPFFVLLSIGGIFWVLGPVDAACLLGIGLILIALSHLPLPGPQRSMVLITVGIVLAILRNSVVSTPWSSAIWPIIGSMFMFRLILYVRDIGSAKSPQRFWFTLAYFFMLPNVAFPLFPVVDYDTFKKTYFDRDEHPIYEQGQLWIVRGIVHLLLYRLVYYNVLNDPTDVVQLSDLIRFMLGTLLLYLRVSGQFHLIVGILHLFGFRLPETHKLYYLASSFTELWRRINIYWTNFMMKVVFYPTYFKVKQLGPKKALVLATATVFFATWILHSYQWFWLRGGFPFTMQDVLFWAILGFLVVSRALKELKSVKAPQQRTRVWDHKKGFRTVLTFVVFCFLWSLWSCESVVRWVWMLGAAANVDMSGIALFLLTFLTIFLLGGVDWSASKNTTIHWLEYFRKPAFRVFTPLVVLLIIAQINLYGTPPERISGILQSLYVFRLNARDAALKHRGYYEQLEVRGQLNRPVIGARGDAKTTWQSPADAGIIRDRSDHLVRDLNPSLDIIWNGKSFSTNVTGMRDQRYELEKPPNTLRIALLGPSHVMGNGVSDHETFETIVEERLNSEFSHGKYERFEILNFAVDGYTIAQQLAILEDRVFGFSPDIVIVTQYHQGRTMTESYLLKIILNDIDLPYESMSSLLAEAGLTNTDKGAIPVPFQSLRNLVKLVGIEPRVPQGELETRIRRIAVEMNGLAIKKIDEVTKTQKVKCIVLVLNEVIDDSPKDIPNLQAIQETDMAVLDLINVFPNEKHSELRAAPWDNHPNADGHKLIAKRLYGELLPLLRSMK